jgi:hypothetical protein
MRTVLRVSDRMLATSKTTSYYLILPVQKGIGKQLITVNKAINEQFVSKNIDCVFHCSINRHHNDQYNVLPEQ